MNPELEIVQAGLEPLIVIGIWVVIIGFSVIAKIVKAAKEANAGGNQRRGNQPRKPQNNPLWGAKAAQPQPQQRKATPPPVPARHRVKVKRAGGGQARAAAVTQQQAAEARRVMEAALQRQRAPSVDDGNYDAVEAYEEEDYAPEPDAYEIGTRRGRKRRHRVLQAMRGRAGARWAIVAREILDRPRAFDI